MNKIIIPVIIAIIIIVGVVFFMTSQKDPGEEGEAQGPTGSVVISVTDAAMDMKNISEIKLTIDDIQMREASGNYVTVSTDDQEYALLTLNAKGEAKLYTNTKIPVGTYSKIRVALDGATVVTADGKTHEAVLVDDNFGVESAIVVEEDQASSVMLDFLASESLHMTAGGEYVFAPVVKLTARSNAEVSVNEQTNVVAVTSGEVTADTTVGMNLDGETEANFKLGTDAQLEVLKDGTVHAVGGVNTSANIKTEAENQIEATVDTAVEEATSTVESTLEAGVEASVNASAKAAGTL